MCSCHKQCHYTVLSDMTRSSHSDERGGRTSQKHNAFSLLLDSLVISDTSMLWDDVAVALAIVALVLTLVALLTSLPTIYVDKLRGSNHIKCECSVINEDGNQPTAPHVLDIRIEISLCWSIHLQIHQLLTWGPIYKKMLQKILSLA